MEQQYAQALWRMVEGGMTPHKAVASLKEVLVKHGRGALLPRVARAFARIAEKEGMRNTIVLTVAREKDERYAKSEAKEVLAALKADASDLETQVDDTLIGGWRLEGRSVLIDNTYKKQLLELYKNVIGSSPTLQSGSRPSGVGI